MFRFRSCLIVVSIALVSFALWGCQSKTETSTTETATSTTPTPSRTAAEEANLVNFDDLDFNVFTGQKWDELSKSHAQNIVVHWPDGRTTTGIDPHIADLKALFTWAPDTRINTHPIKLADGEYTAVTGVFEGTFSAPMTLPDGTVIQPTGKAFKIDMCTVGHWKDGVMDEEWLFWDNMAFMNQIGLGQAK